MPPFTLKFIFIILLGMMPLTSAFALYGYLGDCNSFVGFNDCNYFVDQCPNTGMGDCQSATAPIPFDGGDFGTIGSLTLNKAEQNTFESGGDDVQIGYFHYRIYLAGTIPLEDDFRTIELTNITIDPNETGNDEIERRDVLPNTNIAATFPSGDYVIDVFYSSEVLKSDETMDEIIIDNDGDYFSAIFELNNPNPLVVNSLIVQAEPTKAGTLINWSTESITEGGDFQVQRSTEANANWETIHTLHHPKASITAEQFAFLDKTHITETAYYRVVYQEFSGKKTISNIVVVQANAALFQDIQVFPNPTKDRVQIRFAQKIAVPTTLTIYNAQGKPVKLLDILPSNAASFSFSTQDLSNGLYFLKWNNSSVLQSMTVIK